MGEHSEETAKVWEIGRPEQDAYALASHRRAVAGRERGFFANLIVPVDGIETDAFPRKNSSLEALEKLPPAFGVAGTSTAGSSSPLTDGAAALWVATDAGLTRLPSSTPRARLVDFEVSAVDIFHEGLLMAPAYAIPRLLARSGLRYDDIALWEIHEAFAAQVLYQLKALESRSFLTTKAGVDAELGTVLRVGHYFESGSRRSGCVLVPSPEMVFGRTSGGWSPVSLRDAFAARIAVEVTGELIAVDETVQAELVELANAWLANIHSRLVGAVRRAA
jgi:hypothetical protein